jgi:hypothetical protein
MIASSPNIFAKRRERAIGAATEPGIHAGAD